MSDLYGLIAVLIVSAVVLAAEWKSTFQKEIR